MHNNMILIAILAFIGSGSDWKENGAPQNAKKGEQTQWLHPGEENWMSEFDTTGWKILPGSKLMRGLYRSGRLDTALGIHHIEHVYTAESGRSFDPSTQCYDQDWTEALDLENLWAECKDGYALHGLQRSKGEKLSNIEQGKCCPGVSQSCYMQDVESKLDEEGVSECAPGHALAGFYKGACNDLHCIEAFKCCRLWKYWADIDAPADAGTGEQRDWLNQGEEDWTSKFDNRGWAKLPGSKLMRGLYRSGPETHQMHGNSQTFGGFGIQHIEYVYTAEPGKPFTPSQCYDQDWTFDLDHNDAWAECKAEYALHGLYRSDGPNLSDIEKGRCCPGVTQNCYMQTAVQSEFDKAGVSECAYGHALAGFYKGHCNELHCIEAFKCCRLRSYDPNDVKVIGYWTFDSIARPVNSDIEVEITKTMTIGNSHSVSDSQKSEWSREVAETNSRTVGVEGSISKGSEKYGASVEVSASAEWTKENTAKHGEAFYELLAATTTKTFQQSKTVTQKHTIPKQVDGESIYVNIWYFRTKAIKPDYNRNPPYITSYHDLLEVGIEVRGCGYHIAPNCLPGYCKHNDPNCWKCASPEYEIDPAFQPPMECFECELTDIISGDSSNFQGGFGGWQSYDKRTGSPHGDCEVNTESVHFGQKATAHIHGNCLETQGGIQQTFATEAGITYTLKFLAYAGEWDGKDTDEVWIKIENSEKELWAKYSVGPGKWRSISHMFTATGQVTITIWADVGHCINVDEITLCSAEYESSLGSSPPDLDQSATSHQFEAAQFAVDNAVGFENSEKAIKAILAFIGAGAFLYGLALCVTRKTEYTTIKELEV